VWNLSARSQDELVGVHHDLVRVVHGALARSPVDFAVHDGIRTEAQQQTLVATGVSQTMASRHLTGHAVDLVPYAAGKLRWEWPLLYQIAEAVRQAALTLGVPIRWGGCWDVELTSTATTPEQMAAEYSARRRAAGRRPFLDGPHYELPSRLYP
jgi:peptidoglycan LD-endopeptidase CwlK